MKKILVTSQIPKEGLTQLLSNYEVTYPDKEEFSYEEVLESINGYDAVICVDFPIDKKILESANNLKIISSYGAGYNSVDVEYATSKGIAITNNPDVVTEATAELVVGLMLSVMRKISECDRNLRLDKDFKWGRMNHLGTLIYGKTIGIIGMGRIGKSIAKRCIGMGMNITYHKRNRLDIETEKSLGATYLSMEELLRQSDVVSLNAPLKEDTYHLIGEKELGLMKPSAFIINASRGSVIDEKALVKCLKDNKIAGAGLDVFEKEPGISEELFNMDNVVLTPHIGTQTLDTRIEMARECARKILDLLEGRTPKNIVNPNYLDNLNK